jgi:hypothetical protein
MNNPAVTMKGSSDVLSHLLHQAIPSIGTILTAGYGCAALLRDYRL